MSLNLSRDQYQSNNATIYVAFINSVALPSFANTAQYFNGLISHQFFRAISGAIFEYLCVTYTVDYCHKHAILCIHVFYHLIFHYNFFFFVSFLVFPIYILFNLSIMLYLYSRRSYCDEPISSQGSIKNYSY